MDAVKLMAFCKAGLGHVGEHFYPRLKMSLMGSKTDRIVDYRAFCTQVDKIVNFEIKVLNEIFFGILDLNKDRRVCETDLFRALHLAEREETI